LAKAARVMFGALAERPLISVHAIPTFFEIIRVGLAGCLKRVKAENSVCSKLCYQPESAASW
jgi:hypothetical protein